MIRVLLQGRLGNHLFQIAAALEIAARHNTGIVLDACLLPGMSGEIAFRREPVAQLRFPRQLASVSINRIHRRLVGRTTYEFLRQPVHREQTPEFDPAFASLPDNVVLEGYFQNARYFPSVASLLPGLFDFSPWLDEAAPADREALRHDCTVGLHVRRDDYLQNRSLQVCGTTYYERALARVRESWPQARLLVFSDDLDWCRRHFAALDAVFIDNSRNPYGMLVDMALLSSCRHQIIANSSFSWWAAWLNPNPDRRVFMPDRWTLDGLIPIQTKYLRGAELVPAS